jgi:hypothetical protein
MKHLEGLTRFPPRRTIPYGLRLILALLLLVIAIQPFLSTPVFAQPVINAGSLPGGQVRVPYSANLTATSGNYTIPFNRTGYWAVTGGSLPPGIALTTTTGTISGIPSTAGTFPFFVSVTDSTGTSPQQSFFITISPPPFEIISTQLPQGKEATAYTAALSINGGTPPYYWSISSGSLPSGLMLQPTAGAITGTPSRGTYGTSTFTVYVTDSSSPALLAQMSYSIYIEKGAYQSAISISSGLAAGSTKVTVDGRAATTLRGGEYLALTLDLGTTRNVSVDPIVADPTNPEVRYRARNESLTISELQPSAEFIYYTEYLVAVKSEPSFNASPQGSNWYEKGTAVSASAKTEIEGNPGTLYRFAYWALPNGNQVTTAGFNFTADSPATLTARYDTFYKLTAESVYGQVQGGGWYKAGSEAKWQVTSDKVSMPGIIGFFQGKYTASNPSGAETMDGPKTVTISWQQDYTLPYMLIPVAIIIFALVIVGMYYLLRPQQPLPQPQPLTQTVPYPQYMPLPPPSRAIPRQHTTIVMLGDKGPPPKQLPSSTKEQLMLKFGELLDQYEAEIKTSLGATGLPRIGPVPVEKMLSALQPGLKPAVPAESAQKALEEPSSCRYARKKLLRTITGSWRQTENATVTLPSAAKGKETAENAVLLVMWARDIYQEWELLTCNLPLNHEGKHKGKTQIVYSLLNTVSEKKLYSSTEKPQPPAPHFTDGMQRQEVTDDQIVLADELPTETLR